MIIRKYQLQDERGWVECRVLAFLDTAYFDNVYPHKDHYTHPSLEWVAEEDGRIVGLLDIEYEEEQGTVCSREEGLGAMIWHLAVLPSFRNQGIAAKLLLAAIEELKAYNIQRLEAWTRDDKWVNDWYIHQGFQLNQTYLHVYTEDQECTEVVSPKFDHLHVCTTFSHYVGDNPDAMKQRFQRVHDCNLYIKRIR